MKHLMILRCGKKSIHKFWMHHVKKIMDIAFVYYDDSDFPEDKPTYSYYSKGTKLTGVHDFVTNHKKVIEKYDYFWLFEDDLILPYQTAKQVIDFIEFYKPDLSAPTLTQDSFFTHPITLQLPSLLLRGTDFVECMAPVMSKEFLYNTMEQFMEYPVWGIERYWQHLLWETKTVALLFDQWPIRHTRPIGTGSLYKTANEMSIDYKQDDKKAQDLYTRSFRDYGNILFGTINQFNTPCLYGKNLRKYINMDIVNISKLQGNTVSNNILKKIHPCNDSFSQILSFNLVKKLSHIKDINTKKQ